jgi:hypothetical protein
VSDQAADRVEPSGLDAATLAVLREAVVRGLRGRGEPLLVSDDGALPAAALYAAIHCQRRGWSASASGGDLGSPATAGLVRVLAELWEGRSVIVTDDCGWLPEGAVSPGDVVGELERARGERRDLHVTELRGLDLGAALALLGAVERWGGLVR